MLELHYFLDGDGTNDAERPLNEDDNKDLISVRCGDDKAVVGALCSYCFDTAVQVWRLAGCLVPLLRLVRRANTTARLIL